MKTHVLALILALAATAASAQTYYIDWKKPNPVVGLPSVSALKKDGTVHNSNGKPKELYFRYDLSGINEKHTAQLCMTLCWFLFPGEDDPYLRPGQVLTETGTLPIYIDLATNASEGNSTLKVTLFDKTDTTDALAFEAQFVVSKNTSVVEFADAGITMGPVPATDALTLRGNSLSTATSVGLYDSAGNLVRSYGIPQGNSTSLPLTGLANGTYKIMLHMTDGSYTGSSVVIVR